MPASSAAANRCAAAGCASTACPDEANSVSPKPQRSRTARETWNSLGHAPFIVSFSIGRGSVAASPRTAHACGERYERAPPREAGAPHGEIEFTGHVHARGAEFAPRRDGSVEPAPPPPGVIGPPRPAQAAAPAPYTGTHRY